MHMPTRLNLSTLQDLLRILPEVRSDDASDYLAQLLHTPAFVAAQIVPLLTHSAPAREPSIAISYGARETSTCLQIFVWPAGAATPIHDHTSWGAYQCVIGALVEQRYERLDAGEQPSTARLRKAWQRTWCGEDDASMVLPYEQGIHRIMNPHSNPAISVHLYGPRLGVFDGRDYDSKRDVVCDRLEYDKEAPFQRPVLRGAYGASYL